MTGHGFPLRAMLFAAAALASAAATIVVGQQLLLAEAKAVAAPAVPVSAALPSRNVLVAVRPLAVGARTVAGDLAWRPWPVASLNPAMIFEGTRTIGAFDGHVARLEMLAGEPVTTTRLVAPGTRGTLAAVTTTGLRAVSVALTPTSGVSGLITPGDRVDVVLTYALPQGSAGSGGFERRAATTILSNLRVVAVDQRLSGPAGERKDINNASLEVTARQAEMLALAADLGKLSLSLRSLEGLPEAMSPRGSTVDYEVGRLLPGLAGPRRTATAAAGETGPAPAAFSQFHGGRSDAAEPAQ